MDDSVLEDFVLFSFGQDQSVSHHGGAGIDTQDDFFLWLFFLFFTHPRKLAEKMISFYLLWTLCYFALLRWLAGKWPGKSQKTGSGQDLPAVALLIPLRNEAGNIAALFQQIRKIDYPVLEILLIDDRSEDGSFTVLTEKAKHDDRIKVLQNPGVGKKSALEFGVENTCAELILCSDADCRFPEDWVGKMVAPFSDPTAQMVCGPVVSADRNTFFERFQQIEWASVLLVTQCFFAGKKPLMCSGANLAYRRSAFFAVKGYDQNRQYLSGDDEFLLKKISANFGAESCVYLPFSENMVVTQSQPNFAHLLNQRVRWAGKWKAHRDWMHAFSAFGSFLIQGIWLASILLLGLGAWGILVFLTVWTGKILAEKSALGSVLKALGFRLSLADFVKSGLLHPFYVLTVAVGALRGKFGWKGRFN